jgi:hypothetical protein
MEADAHLSKAHALSTQSTAKHLFSRGSGAGDKPSPTHTPPFHESPPPVAVAGGLIPLVSPHGVAWPWQLSGGKQRRGDQRGGGAPHPLGCWSRAAAGFERMELCDIPFAIARCDGLTLVVTCLSGIDAVGQKRAPRGRRPEVVETGGGRCLGGTQVFGDGPTTAVLFDQQPIDAPHAVRFPRRTQHVGRSAVALGQIAVSSTPLRPGEQCSWSSRLPGGRGAQRMRQKAHGRVECGALLDQAPLLGIMARQPVR